MEQMKLDIFKNASTFTWVGRHASELRFLVDSLRTLGREPRAILDAGCGPFEPFYLAQMLGQKSIVYAVDANKMVTDTLAHLCTGQDLPLSLLSHVCCNKDDLGNIIPNTDLTDPDLIEKGKQELRKAGLKPELFVHYADIGRLVFHAPKTRDDPEYFRHHGAEIVCYLDDVIERVRACKNNYHFVYAGALLLNIAKDRSPEEMTEIMGVFKDSLKENGVFGIGTTPAALYGEKSEPLLLRRAGLTMTDLILDNLVQVGGKLRGGYMLRAVKDSQAITGVSYEFSCSFNDKFWQDICSEITASSDQLADYFQREGDTLVIAALKRGKDEYVLYEADRRKLVERVPQVRQTFDLFDRTNQYCFDPSD